MVETLLDIHVERKQAIVIPDVILVFSISSTIK